REGSARRGHELVDESVVIGAGGALLTKADVVGVVEKLFIVGADIERDRQALLGMHARTGGVKRELSDRNAHAVGAEVAEAKNAFTIGHDDQFGAIGPVRENLCDAAAVIVGDEQAARPLEDQAVFLAGKTYGRGIDQRLNFIDVIADDPEEQRFV